MKLFIWKSVRNLTENYHSDGGLVVVAKDLDDARIFLKNHLNYAEADCEAFTTDPDATYELANNHINAFYVFPDAGCC
jgi:hypothetical protein